MSERIRPSCLYRAAAWICKAVATRSFVVKCCVVTSQKGFPQWRGLTTERTNEASLRFVSLSFRQENARALVKRVSYVAAPDKPSFFLFLHLGNALLRWGLKVLFAAKNEKTKKIKREMNQTRGAFVDMCFSLSYFLRKKGLRLCFTLSVAFRTIWTNNSK